MPLGPDSASTKTDQAGPSAFGIHLLLFAALPYTVKQEWPKAVKIKLIFCLLTPR
jgi:hypothetical protein